MTLRNNYPYVKTAEKTNIAREAEISYEFIIDIKQSFFPSGSNMDFYMVLYTMVPIMLWCIPGLYVFLSIKIDFHEKTDSV